MSMSGQPQRPQPRDSVMSIPVYVPGKSKVKTDGPVHKLSSNETPLGASAKAVDAYRQIAGQLEYYPDGASTALREAIGDVHGIHPGRILCGAGSDEILTMIANTFLEKGDEAIYCEHGFLVYPIVIQAAGAKPVKVKEKNCVTDVDAIFAAVTERTKVVFLANPNNPTGTYLPFTEIRRLHEGLPGSVLLVLDAAYAEYVTAHDYQSGIELAGASENVLMTRTFSKIYGLANLRLGWCFGPEAVIQAMERVRGPFNVSGAAQAAGIAAIRDQDFVRAAVAHNNEWLPKLTKGLEDLGLTVTPSVGNFILIHFTDAPGKSAVEADDYLLSHGCILRQVGNYGFPNALRMTVGSAEACERVLSLLGDFMRGSGND